MQSFTTFLAFLFVGLWYGGKPLLRLFARLLFATPTLANAMAQYQRKRDSEQATLEVAPWIGQTGLDEATERELPRYLRRELGEFLDDGGLKASDLQYLGLFQEAGGAVHYWQMPHQDSEPVFAYVEVDHAGTAKCLGWGDKAPMR